jgi:hypothetical protein
VALNSLNLASISARISSMVVDMVDVECDPYTNKKIIYLTRN